MFGYINVNGKELSIESKQTYQSYYCGLCRQLKQDFGVKGKMLLSYDMTFLVVLLTGLYEPDNTEELFTCAIHPTKKRTSRTNTVSEYAAAMNLILAYHNLEDDWKDERNMSKHAMAVSIRKDYQRIAEHYPRQVFAIEDYIRNLDQAETDHEMNIDLVAGLTGQMLGELFAWRQDEWYPELKTLGFYLGKFIYLMDAWEDLDEDDKNHSYNPLRQLKEDHPTDYETIVRLMMTSMMAECAKSFERLPIIEHADILRNILYSGVWSKYEYGQLKKEAKRKKQEKKIQKQEQAAGSESATAEVPVQRKVPKIVSIKHFPMKHVQVWKLKNIKLRKDR